MTLLGINLLLIAAGLAILWRHTVKGRLVRPETADGEVEKLTDRLTPGLAGYMVVIILGLFLPVVAVFGYPAMALLLLVPLRLRRPTAG